MAHGKTKKERSPPVPEITFNRKFGRIPKKVKFLPAVHFALTSSPPGVSMYIHIEYSQYGEHFAAFKVRALLKTQI